MKWSRIAALAVGIAAVWASGLPLPAQGYVEQGYVPASDGDISWNLHFTDTLHETDCAYLYFEREDAQSFRALKITSGIIFILKQENGIESFLGTGVPFEPLTRYLHVITVRRRAANLSVFIDGVRLTGLADEGGPRAGAIGYQVEPANAQAWIHVSPPNWIKAPEIQFERRFETESRSRPPAFPQDIGWDILAGAWRLRPAPGTVEESRPVGRYTGRNGLALTGETAWDTYAARVAVRLGGTGPVPGGARVGAGVPQPTGVSGSSAGLAFYAVSRDRYYLLRLVGNEEGTNLQLVKVVKGTESILKTRPTQVRPHQWARIKVLVSDNVVKAYLDGQFAFLAYDNDLVGGRVGLCAQGAEASRFDDLLVRSIRASRAEFLKDRDGRIDQMASLNEPLPAARADKAGHPDQSDWRKEQGPDGVLFENLNDYYGNVGLRWMPLRPMIAGGSAALSICGDEVNPHSGYSLTILQGANKEVTLRLQRRERELKVIHLTPPGAEPATPASAELRPAQFLLSKSGALITACLNGVPVIEFSDPEALAGTRVRFQTDLLLCDAPADLSVENENERTYLFTSAPVDWTIGSGDWDIFPAAHISGAARANGNVLAAHPPAGSPLTPSIVWNKGSYAGDFSLEYDVSACGHDPADAVPPNFNAVFCADGRDLDSGYCLVFSARTAPPRGPGAPPWPIRLFRQGKVVAESRSMLYQDISPSADDPPPAGDGWRLRVQRREGLLQFFVNNRLAIEYRERKPLAGTRFGLWTVGTSMALSRVRIAWSENAPAESVFGPPAAAPRKEQAVQRFFK